MNNSTQPMIGIDTNILVRYIMQDDAHQAKIASDFLENLSNEHLGFISNIVVIELIWVLSRTYKLPRASIVLVLDELFAMDVLRFEHHHLLIETLQIYQHSRADFSDVLINKINLLYGCQYTITFDKTAYQKAGMKSLL